MTITERNQLIVLHMDLAKKIALTYSRKISCVDKDELVSAAYFGLVDAAEKYKFSKSDNFAAYAVIRIIGAIKDYLRELAWGSRQNPVQMVNYDHF